MSLMGMDEGEEIQNITNFKYQQEKPKDLHLEGTICNLVFLQYGRY